MILFYYWTLKCIKRENLKLLLLNFGSIISRTETFACQKKTRNLWNKHFTFRGFRNKRVVYAIQQWEQKIMQKYAIIYPLSPHKHVEERDVSLLQWLTSDLDASCWRPSGTFYNIPTFNTFARVRRFSQSCYQPYQYFMPTVLPEHFKALELFIILFSWSLWYFTFWM